MAKVISSRLLLSKLYIKIFDFNYYIQSHKNNYSLVIFFVFKILLYLKNIKNNFFPSKMKNHDQYFNFLVLFKQQKQVILGSLKRENYVKGQVYKFMPFLQLQNEKNNSWCCDFFNPSPKIRIITMKLPLKLLVLRYFGFEENFLQNLYLEIAKK